MRIIPTRMRGLEYPRIAVTLRTQLNRRPQCVTSYSFLPWLESLCRALLCVNHSRFAEFAHIPVAAIGIAGYAVLGLLALLRFNRLLLAASLLGLVFALYLTNIEAHVLQVWCLYCVISQAIIALLAVCTIVTALLPGRSRPARSASSFK